MRSYISQLRTSRSYFAWIAGILLSIALTLFIISHIHVRWSVFPFAYRNIGSVYSGLWYRHAVYSGRLVKFRITCANERLPCIKLILARIFMVMACITSSIGVICLCIISIFKNFYKSIMYIGGFGLACLSFIFGLTGFLFGLGWIIQFERDKLGSAAICALVGSFFSLVSGICAFFINSKESI
ncbi:unnamed protein product [Rotaria sp. Silwood2]|nr:unnamed protein product [Rotaria sp. Silwood2]CAF2717502.1 unnamed protein product [Rotaria sp. Silwood2]CAF2971156.1 unnamed protein product [Rotaria sp. Silwood2]CAF4043797.1 unnamed protein product [Rotaria sp. Silwood2]CAF4083323.1 unnamed protein product [Rotaria sp. Silwood2]